MEVILLILLDVLAAPLVALVSGILALLSSLAATIFSLVLDRWLGTPWRGSQPDTSRTPRRWPGIVRNATLALAAAVGTGLLVVDLFFFEDVARYALEQQRQRTGIAVDAARIDGSLFTGRVEAEDVVVRREGGAKGAIDLRIARLEAVVDVFDVLAEPRSIDVLRLQTVRGSFERRSNTAAGSNANAPKKPRREFTIRSLSLADVQVDYVDATRPKPLELAVVVERFDVGPLRRRVAVYDVLFRGNGNGSIEGHPFSIATTGDPMARTTQWRATDLPVDLLAAQLGGVFEILARGSADVAVDNQWEHADDGLVVAMDWTLELKDLEVRVPEDASPWFARLTAPLTELARSRREPVRIHFQVAVDSQRLEVTGSEDAAALWHAVAAGAAAGFAERFGLDLDQVKEAAGRAAGAAKTLLDELRKKRKK